MNKPIKFKWEDGCLAYLWPDHPLVLAGESYLEVVDDLQGIYNKEELCLKLSQKYNVPLIDVHAFVDSIEKAINGIKSNNIVNDTPPAAYDLSMATLNITKNCNMKCLHCYAGQTLCSFEEELSSEAIENIIIQLSDLIIRKPRLLILSGGEPLLEKNKLKTAVLTGIKNGFEVRINTNGILIDNEIARFLSEQRVLTQVSLDGIDAETNMLLRGSKQYFYQTISSINTLLEFGCRVRVSTTIHSMNVNQIPSMIDLCEDLGVEQFVTSNLVSIGNALKNKVSPVSFKEEFATLYKTVRNNKHRQKMTRSTLLAETIIAIRSGLRFVYCGTGCSTVCVDSDGSVYPCINMLYDQYRIGNLKNTKMQTMWANSATLKGLRNLDISKMNNTCKKCHFRHFCGGYCRGETIANGMDIHSPYVRCAEWKQGLIEVLHILAQCPEIYDFNDNILVGLHHE